MTYSACRLIFWVKDPKKLSTWYHEMFGFTERVNHEDEGWIELDSGACIIALHAGATVTPREWPKLQLEVDDLPTALQDLTARGLTPSQLYTWKHLSWFQLKDPEGNTIQICSTR